jgi:transcriptional regulator of arginine metabolism
MKLEYVIKNIIQNSKIKTQNELTEVLSKKGFNATQSNISRILKKINTTKVTDENKDSYYIIRNRPLEITSELKKFVISVENNGIVVVIKTYDGSAKLIDKILNERSIENVMTTVATDDVILVIPENTKQIVVLTDKLKDIFSSRM